MCRILIGWTVRTKAQRWDWMEHRWEVAGGASGWTLQNVEGCCARCWETGLKFDPGGL